MAGGVLKTFGIIFIVVGGVAVLLGLAAAVLGGAVFSGAVDDAGRSDCGFLHNEPCHDGTASDRAEGGMLGVVAGGAGILGGLVLVALGVGLLLWGISRARKAAAAQSPPPSNFV